jgi:hypothetical protein
MEIHHYGYLQEWKLQIGLIGFVYAGWQITSGRAPPQENTSSRRQGDDR